MRTSSTMEAAEAADRGAAHTTQNIQGPQQESKEH